MPNALTPVPFPDVHIRDDFWSQRLRVNRASTIEANLRQCEITGRIKNFAVAGKLQQGHHEGALYNDSDVYKMIEGIAYALADKRDPDLEKRADAIIDQIAAAQQPDGYLNTYYTLAEPQNRWKNIQYGHELYCAGHLIEAAVAYQQATGKHKLLDTARKLADHIDSVFGPGKKIDASGHEEIELALIKLYRATKEERYLKLALFFLDVRGHKEKRRLFGEYAQDAMPIRDQDGVVGHAVRAMYLYCAMADAATLTGDPGLIQAMDKIWRDVTERKMYVTGGIGPSASNEGFTVPYDLPNDSAYCETCAAVGMALWNQRLFLMSGDGKYADVVEREAYNGLISGVSLSGDRFFYGNPLGSDGGYHRVAWFGTSCCPTNIVRYIPAMGERVYAQKDDAIWTVLYMGNTAELSLKSGKVKLTEETKYPWQGDVRITIEPEKTFAFDLNVRIPGWCKGEPEVLVNDEKLSTLKTDKGYLRIAREWKSGDVVRLNLPMPVERVYADAHVKADVGRVALQRGPVVYCLEGVDNSGQVRNLILSKDAKLTASFDKDLMGGVVVVKGEAEAVASMDDDGKLTVKPTSFTATPYCTWDNRKPGPMVVWLPETPELAKPPDGRVPSNGVWVRASHVWTTDTLAAVNDGVVPKASADAAIPRQTWWDHQGTEEWMSYRFPKPRKINGCATYWFDDSGVGGCRVPAEWRLLWRDGDEWKPVKLIGDAKYGTALDQFNQVSFEPVVARELKMEVKLKQGFSGGVLKWKVSEEK